MENQKATMKFWLSIISVVLGVMALTMMFLPAMSTTITKTGEEVGLYNVFQLMFGKQEKGITVIEFSILNCISLLLIIVAVVLAILNFIKSKEDGDQQVIYIISAVFFVVGGILSVFAINFAVFVGDKWSIFTNTLREAPILVGAISCIAGGCCFAPILLNSKE